MKALRELYELHRGKVSDRWELYLREYDRVLTRWRRARPRLLEIGIQNGGSLEIWAKYFPDGECFVGCDVEPSCANLKFEDPRISVVVADACSDAGQKCIEHLSQSFDIVIDDASHRSAEIVQAFARYFPLVSNNGVYVVEDLHCSYWQEFQGGLVDPVSSISFFKRLSDITNYEHWRTHVDRAQYLKVFSDRYGCEFEESVLAQIYSVEFVNSMCVVRKAENSGNLLGRRVIVGEHEAVTSDVQRYKQTYLSGPDQSNNPWSSFGVASFARGNESVSVLENYSLAAGRVTALEAEITKLSASFKRELRLLELNKEAELRAKDGQIAQLVSAQSTILYRLARASQRRLDRLLPIGSGRRSAISALVGFVLRVYRQRFCAPISKASFANTSVTPTDGRTVSATAAASPSNFAAWIAKYEPNVNELEQQKIGSTPYDPESPMFSVILPVYKVPTGVLRATIASLRQQTWQDWEACVAYADVDNEDNWSILSDVAKLDSRFKLLRLKSNEGISSNSNAALGLACGTYVALLDHDDELTPWAFHAMAMRINSDPSIDFLYSDKDSINASGSLRQHPLFKPEWSPEMMYSANYLTHLNVIRRRVVSSIGGWRSITDGAQDWDLFLRATERCHSIERVPGIGYHWRIIEGSTSTGIAAKPYAAQSQLRTLKDRVHRLGLAANVIPSVDSGFQVMWDVHEERCSDLILYGDESQSIPHQVPTWVLAEFVGIAASVTIVIRKNGTYRSSLIANQFADIPVSEITYGDEESFADVVHRATQVGKDRVVLLVNLSALRWQRDSASDIVGWVGSHPEVGFAGALLLTPDDVVLEAGRVAGDCFRTLPLFHGAPLRSWGPLGGPLWYRNVSAVSPHAVAFKREVLCLGQNTHLRWPDAFTACCLAAATKGFRGMVSPHARAYFQRLPNEGSYEWHESFRNDRYFHPAFGSVVPLDFDTPDQKNEKRI